MRGSTGIKFGNTLILFYLLFNFASLTVLNKHKLDSWSLESNIQYSFQLHFHFPLCFIFAAYRHSDA